MKFNINKACDLSSISVLPPQIRRPNTGQQMSQIRSQQSQQSFSQSQHGITSQFSQNSLDEILANERFSSQDKESSIKRPSGMGTLNYHREESQKPIFRPSTDVLRKWNSSTGSDSRQIGEALEQRVGRMETSVARIGMILDSVQSDMLQANKVTKEVSQELEGIKQKLNHMDSSLQQMNKGQQDTKASINGSLKEVCDQLSKDVYEGKVQEILMQVYDLPERIETCFLRLQNHIGDTFKKELQALGCSLKPQNQKNSARSILPPTDATCCLKFNELKEPLKIEGVPSKVIAQSPPAPEIQIGGWKSIKRDRRTITCNGSNKLHRQNGVSVIQKEKEWKVTIDSDEEFDGGFSCFLEEKETGIVEDCVVTTKAETERILRNARRRNRRIRNTIIIN